MSNTMVDSQKLGNSLYRAYKKHAKDGCQDLLLEWVGECFWGRVVKEHIPIFKESWNILQKGGYTKNNPFVHGDIDVGVWYEKTKEKNRKVIISESYCSCADDNINIFVLDEYSLDWEPTYDMTKFKAVTVWQKEKGKGGYKTAKGGWHFWGDDRDITIPSLNTYRKRGFNFGYNDCRDKGHVFKFEGINNRVEKASWSSSKIPHTLQVLRWDLSALKEAPHFDKNGVKK